MTRRCSASDSALRGPDDQGVVHQGQRVAVSVRLDERGQGGALGQQAAVGDDLLGKRDRVATAFGGK